MTTVDYPLLGLPGYEMYQLAHIATFIADALARHRRAPDRGARDTAARDVAAGRVALDRATGDTGASTPRPIDARTYRAAREAAAGRGREAEVVALAERGAEGWAVVGRVPGLGPVGALTTSRATADALRHHFLTQPRDALVAWVVTDRRMPVPRHRPRVDLAAVVENLDPHSARDRVVAGRLRGSDRRVDAAIRGRFAGVDLDAPVTVRPPSAPHRSPRAAAAPQREAGRHTTSAARVPTSSAGP